MAEQRLIDANALLKQIDFEYDLNYGEILTDPRKFADMVEDAPTVDAVPVVRCKDCKHYKPQKQSAHWKCTSPYCMRVVAVKVKPDDFCSYGQRKEN